MTHSGLNKEQEKAVMHPGGPLLMAAGAGSGKTKALTSRLKELISRGTLPHEVIAITFTNKAAGEMRKRVFGENAEPAPWTSRFPVYGHPFIGTFHSLGAKILKQELKLTGRKPGFSIFDSDDSLSLIKKICTALDLPKDKFRPPVIASQISAIKSELREPDELFEKIWSRYELALLENNAFDFDDLIEKPVKLLTNNLELRTKYQKLFSQILVDEYQDINTAQYQLIRLLAEKHGNVSAVGDDQQAIYAFRGADFRNFLNFRRDWPEATVIKLEQNYRSTKNIISSASAVIKNNKLQTPKDLWTDNPSGGAVKIIAAEDPDTEAVWVASEIRELKTKNLELSTGIIYRTNAQSRAIEQALISENIPYKIFGGLKFYDRKEIKDILAGLRLAQNPTDSTSIERLQKSLGIRGSKAVLAEIPNLGEKMQAAELIRFFVEKSNYKDLLEAKFDNPQERLENIAELTAFAETFTTLEEFLERASLLQSSDVPAGQLSEKLEIKNYKLQITPVNLMTIHIAKGLEFDNVFIIGCNEGTLPHERSMIEPMGIEEERRLMYVAMTRARKQLYILFHAFPSRFLGEIPEEFTKFISVSGMMDKLPSEDDMWIEN